MTSRLVVPTLAHVPSINQSLGPFWVASCESRAKLDFGHFRRVANDESLVIEPGIRG
jgi:hypothetical protein